MKLILTAPIDKLGVPGDIVEVKDLSLIHI